MDLLSPVAGTDRSVRKVQVHQHTAFVDLLVEHPQFAFCATVIPSGQLLVNLTHRLDVETAVVPEALPFYRVRCFCGPTYFPAFRLGLTEQIDPSPSFFVFRLVYSNAQDRTKRPKCPR